MTSLELQDYINIYSLISFSDGSKEPGIIFNKYNTETARVEFFFVPQHNMGAYKKAFDIYDKETCSVLSKLISSESIQTIRPVSLSDFKIIMQLLEERRQLLNG